MCDTDEKLDILLERNVSEQLAQVNWEQLSASISNRLDVTSTAAPSKSRLSLLLKSAAAAAAAASIVAVALLLGRTEPRTVPLEHRSRAAVKLVVGGSASVQIQGLGRQEAACEVVMTDSNGKQQLDSRAEAWIIISIPQPVMAENGAGKYEDDIIFLF